MRSAVYYPHWSIREDDESSVRALKRALLMWDELAFIVPWDDFRPTSSHSYDIAEAVEIIGRYHVPTPEEQELAHEDILEIVTKPGGLPEAFSFTTSEPHPYEVYPRKFLDKTWLMLQDQGFAGYSPETSERLMSQVGGLCIMGILADACAGVPKARHTDSPGAYASIANLLCDQDAQQTVNDQADADRLVAVTLKVARFEGATLRSLIEMRKRERDDSALQTVRHTYVSKVEEQLNKLKQEVAKTTSDKAEIIRQFEADMQADFDSISTALGLEFVQAAGAPAMVVSLLAGAAAVASFAFGVPIPVEQVITATGAVATLGGVFASAGKFAAKRAEILEKHPMAYLYEARGGLRL